MSQVTGKRTRGQSESRHDPKPELSQHQQQPAPDKLNPRKKSKPNPPKSTSIQPVDTYIASLSPGPNRLQLSRLHNLINTLVPSLEQGTSYNLACYLYRSKPLAAIVVNKNYISWYPYSGGVINRIPELRDYKQTKGALQFTAVNPLSDEMVEQLVRVKQREIDEKLDANKSARRRAG